jgi:hypothetical protein
VILHVDGDWGNYSVPAAKFREAVNKVIALAEHCVKH